MRTAIWRNTLSWPKRLATMALFLASAGLVDAQGVGGLSQPADFQQLHSRGQSATAVTVQRGAAPHMREFTKETTNSARHASFAGSDRLVGLLLLGLASPRPLVP
jgi:hypothetical protein